MFVKEVLTGYHDCIPMSVPTSHDIEVRTYKGCVKKVFPPLHA
jgi:hypothetical protein